MWLTAGERIHIIPFSYMYCTPEPPQHHPTAVHVRNQIPDTVSFYIKLSLTLSTSQYKFYIMLEWTDAQTAQVHSLLVSLCHVWCLLHAYMKAAPSLKPHRVFPWMQTHLKQTIFFCMWERTAVENIPTRSSEIVQSSCVKTATEPQVNDLPQAWTRREVVRN